MAKQTLYEIGDDMRAVEQLLEDNGGDISDPMFEAAIDDWIKTNKDNLVKKLDSYGHLITERKGYAEMRVQESKRLQEMAAVDFNLIDKLKARLKYFFEEWGIKKIESDHFKWAIQGNGGTRAMVLWPEFEAQLVEADNSGDWSKIPTEYQITKTVLNTGVIRKQLEELDALEIKKARYLENVPAGFEPPYRSSMDISEAEALTEFTAEDDLRLSTLAIVAKQFAYLQPKGTHLRIR